MKTMLANVLQAVGNTPLVRLNRVTHNYIVNQDQPDNNNPNAWGTGGTRFAPYLKKHPDETARHKMR